MLLMTATAVSYFATLGMEAHTGKKRKKPWLWTALTYYKLKYILENSGKVPEYAVLSVDPANFSPKAGNTLKFDGYWRKYLDYPALARETGDYDYYIKWFTGRFCAYIGNYKFI